MIITTNFIHCFFLSALLLLLLYLKWLWLHAIVSLPPVCTVYWSSVLFLLVLVLYDSFCSYNSLLLPHVLFYALGIILSWITAKAFLISPHNNYNFHCNAVNNPTTYQQTSECYQWRGGGGGTTLLYSCYEWMSDVLFRPIITLQYCE